MNYIKQLQADNAAAKNQANEILNDIIAFKAMLASPKFTGVESDGSRKDWISTGDVDRFLSDLGSKALALVQGE